ncbi:MAG: biopolymer transporter ExbD [Acidobacteria bacterium]|nr:MAG: biopolymer transporter ExbD [Acidobacteriota bacterium]
MKMARREVPAEIPTASMADVAFLLIIFFLVASFYSVTRGVQFSLPRHDEATVNVEPEASVLVEVGANGALQVDGRGMALGDLTGYLRPKLVANPGKPVIMRTALDAPYSAMTDVFDELRQVGVRNVVIPTQTELALYGLEGQR